MESKAQEEFIYRDYISVAEYGLTEIQHPYGICDVVTPRHAIEVKLAWGDWRRAGQQALDACEGIDIDKLRSDKRFRSVTQLQPRVHIIWSRRETDRRVEKERFARYYDRAKFSEIAFTGQIARPDTSIQYKVGGETFHKRNQIESRVSRIKKSFLASGHLSSRNLTFLQHLFGTEHVTLQESTEHRGIMTMVHDVPRKTADAIGDLIATTHYTAIARNIGVLNPV